MIRLLALLLVLSGCASTAPVQAPPIIIHEPKLADQLPKSLTQCLPEPYGGAVETNSDAEQYVISLRSAGRDCRAKLKAVKTIVYGERMR
jgi:hypothetical protein